MGSMDIVVTDVGDLEISSAGARAALKSPEVAAALKAHADRIAASINSEGRGEFRSGQGTGGASRAHAFVNTYDRHARRTANVDPAIFQRHV